MFELTISNLKKFMDATLILKNITFQVYSGEKVGIVGANGSGKSTVLKIIAGILPMHYYPGYPQTSSPGYDEGIISKPREATCAYLEQIPQYPDGLRVIDILKLAFDEIYNIESQMRELEEKMKVLEDDALQNILKHYSQLVQLYEIKGGYDTEEKLSKVCNGLKFSKSFLNREFSQLSGGEKTTVVLGKLLLSNPDILLLDEPTNHLDMDSIEWLEDFLKAYRGIVIVVSHDRYFLDNVVTKIVEIEDMECETYKGNYTSFVEQKDENLRIQYDNYREQQKQINDMEKTIKDLRDWALRADNNKFFRRAVSIQKKLDKMDRVKRPVFEKANMKLNLKASQRSGFETIKAVGLTKSFGEKVILKNADLLVKFGERTALIGPNGCGKTSFLKMLLGEESPDAGVVQLGSGVIPAYLPQHISFPNEELTVVDCFRDGILIQEGKAREYLSKFMFYGSSVYKKVKSLSGGEKIRLKLAKLLYEDVNMLILDEPTNHLDIDSIETLEEALDEFNGTLFFISHDRYFINKVCGRVIAIEDNAFKSYSGNYDYYKSIRKDLNRQLPKEPAVKSKTAKNAKDSQEADLRQQKQQEANTEAKIESIENEIREIDFKMSEAGMNYEELNKLYSSKEELSRELDKTMELWLELQK